MERYNKISTREMRPNILMGRMSAGIERKRFYVVFPKTFVD